MNDYGRAFQGTHQRSVTTDSFGQQGRSAGHIAELFETLQAHHIPQRALDAKTPIMALMDWYKERPNLFVKRVYHKTGLENYADNGAPIVRGETFNTGRSYDASCPKMLV